MTNWAKFVLAMAVAVSGGVLVPAQESAPAGGQQAAPTATEAAAVVPEDQQPTDSQLNRLFDVMRVKQQMASLTKMMPQIMRQEMESQIKQMQEDHPEMGKMTPEQQKAFSDALGRFMEKAMTLYTTDDMMTDMKAIYKKHLSQSDVENIITFYGSSSGQRILDMVPVIMQEYMPAVMHKTEERMKPLLEELQLELAQIVAKPSDAGSAPKQ